MNPLTHLFLGWTLATLPERSSRTERAWIVGASLLPDLDGLGLIAEIATRNSEHPLFWWSEAHHVLGHNLGAALAVTAAALAFTRSRRTALLAAVSFHLHLLGDLVGGRGPDGAQWPIPYLLPFSARLQLTVPWQWALNAWPNILSTVLLMAYALHYAWKHGESPLSFLSSRANAALVGALRRRFPRTA